MGATEAAAQHSSFIRREDYLDVGGSKLDHADPVSWVEFSTSMAGIVNWTAVLLTLLAAVYHAYGFVQYKEAIAQEKHVHEEEDDNATTARDARGSRQRVTIR